MHLVDDWLNPLQVMEEATSRVKLIKRQIFSQRLYTSPEYSALEPWSGYCLVLLPLKLVVRLRREEAMRPATLGPSATNPSWLNHGIPRQLPSQAIDFPQDFPTNTGTQQD
jgi:hypothetical protein